MSSTANIDTHGYAVAGAAYGSSKGQLLGNTSLTHAVLDWSGKKALCGKVQVKSLLDDACIGTDEPTCPACRAKLTAMGVELSNG